MTESPLPSATPIARVVGLCHAIRDVTFALTAEEISDARRLGLVDSGVSFLAPPQFRDRVERMSARYPRRRTICPGGPVSNSLYAIGARLPRYPRTLALAWSGPYRVGVDHLAGDPLAALRSVGVATYATPPEEGTGLLESACVVSSETGETVSILVGPRPARRCELPPLRGDDLLLAKLAELRDVLALLPDEACSGVAFVTADHDALAHEDRLALEELAERGLLRFAFGRRAELEALGLLAAEGPDAVLRTAEVVATSDAGPVAVYAPGDPEPSLLPVAPMPALGGASFLGAGDAYAGAFLCARLLGHHVTSAHEWGVSEARLVSYTPPARRRYSANLTELFGRYIERRSSTPDWDVMDRVRQTSGLTVVTCGQTGVDQLALRSARERGLATFAILPEGRRTERADGVTEMPDDFADACVLELGSQRYRYCTWANVFVADGTLLLDLAASEGSEETRRACRILDRPLMELTDVDPATLELEIADWVRRHAVRVMHVAGTRRSAIPAERRGEARSLIERAVAAAAAALVPPPRWERSDQPAPPARTAPATSARIGFPALPETRALVQRFLFETQGLEARSNALVVELDEGEVCFGRSRDLVAMVDTGVLDVAYVGSDAVAEMGAGDYDVVGLTGFFNCLLAVVAPSAAEFAPRRLVPQYPRVAAERFAADGVEIHPIAGAAECWVATGEFDGAVDTWRTGQTASENGLEFVDSVTSTSLALLRRGDAAPWAQRIAREFWHWLRLEAPPHSAPVLERIEDGSGLR